MEAMAPNAQTKEVLGFVVTPLTDYSNSTTLAKWELFQTAHSAQFKSGVEVLASSVAACAMSGVNTLP